MLRSMLSGRLNRNLKRCRTFSAFRVESALSFRPKTSWKRVSAVSLAPMRNKMIKEKKVDWNTTKQCWWHTSPLNLWFPYSAVRRRITTAIPWSDSLGGLLYSKLASWVASNVPFLKRGLIKTKPHPQNKIPEGKAAWDRTHEYVKFFILQIWERSIPIFDWLMFCRGWLVAWLQYKAARMKAMSEDVYLL